MTRVKPAAAQYRQALNNRLLRFDYRNRKKMKRLPRTNLGRRFSAMAFGLPNDRIRPGSRNPRDLPIREIPRASGHQTRLTYIKQILTGIYVPDMVFAPVKSNRAAVLALGEKVGVRRR
ncbi:TPA: hypothetical protein SAY52_004311 [Burkholderia cenocepacia]|uniref:hypothetical protein n=1 Tax=unclassified Burkholderia TaxID=2613784 RepID=UPI00158F53DC|nr:MULTISPECIES: hypothetical protein [unclassified Burkholderia]HEF5873654.1 hypothetical protein [Burkholderia cenocepacia]